MAIAISVHGNMPLAYPAPSRTPGLALAYPTPSRTPNLSPNPDPNHNPNPNPNQVPYKRGVRTTSVNQRYLTHEQT